MLMPHACFRSKARTAHRDHCAVAMRRRPLPEQWMSSEHVADDERIRLAKAYFAKVDAGDGALLDMFTDDAQAYFPKIGTTRGKAALVNLVQTLTSVVRRFVHDPRHMVFTLQGTRLVVEGVEAGELADGTPFPAGAKSAGRFCNVFEFEGPLIRRLHIYADPDFAGQFDGPFATSAPSAPVASRSNPRSVHDNLAIAANATATIADTHSRS